MPKYFEINEVHGLAGQFISATFAYRIGRYLGSKGKKILVAYDTRLSSNMLISCLGAGITISGGDLFDIGLSTTPSILFLLKKHEFDFGVMITSRVSSFEDNGFIFFDKNANPLDEKTIFEIEKYIDSSVDSLPSMTGKKMGRFIFADDLRKEYISYLISMSSPLVAKLKVAIDAANGSTSKMVPFLLEELGSTVTIRNAAYDGENINVDSGFINTKELSQFVKEGNIDVAFAFDGSGDHFKVLSSTGKVYLEKDIDALLKAKDPFKEYEPFSKDDPLLKMIKVMNILAIGNASLDETIR